VNSQSCAADRASQKVALSGRPTRLAHPARLTRPAHPTHPAYLAYPACLTYPASSATER
jgi:hypothetical protein